MKSRFACLLLANLIAAVLPVAAQDARFFRVAGPVPVTLTAVTPAGWVTWTNAPTNAIFRVQTATVLGRETNWVDWVQVPVTNAVTIHRVFDPNPPDGMAFIPAGSFTMGNCMATNEGYGDELPPHTVFVSAFYLDQYEVTKALWDEVQAWNGGNGYGYDSPTSGLGKASNHPAHTMTWYDCVKWCNARSQKEGLVPCYYTDADLTVVYKTGQVTNPYVNWSASGYRLPTEAEWEKAARGGTSGHRFPWSDSDTIQHARANYYSSPDYAYDTSPTRVYHPTFATGAFPYTSPVGYFAPNGYGLHDMAGNVLEWCWDWYGSTWYANAEATQTDTRGPSGAASYRVLRGGSWVSHARFARCAARYNFTPSDAYYLLGFRCVLASGSAP